MLLQSNRMSYGLPRYSFQRSICITIRSTWHESQGGVTGILVQGSNGEAQHLSHDERKEAIATTRRTLDENGFKDVVVIAGTGGQSTRETKKLCTDAREAGAAYALVLTPSTWPPQMTKPNIIRFHREVGLV